MPSSILFVHQGYELYGSDRTLIQSVSAAAARWPGARITVLLPSDGPLMAALREIVDDVRVCELAVLRKSHLKHIRLRDIGSFVGKIAAARRMMQSYDVTYINTVMVMDYILAGSMVGRPHLVHVHEIPTGGAALFFSTLLGLSRSFLVFNSQATERGLKLGFWQRKAVLWNGVAGPGQLPARAAHDRLHLLLIGRFNAWKGQLLLLQAIARLPGHLRDRVRVRLVGGVFGGQSHFADRLASMIAEEKLTEVAEIRPFAADPSPHYAWADAVVVPSTKPEPFGLVAIEAMAWGCSVIAANHGGLAEIVVDGVTGSLVRPGSADALASAIARYLENPGLAAEEGVRGRERFEARFEESHYKAGIVQIIAAVAGAELV